MRNSNTNAEAKRILVVEDELSIRRVFSETLTSEGFEVHVAANGVQAESKLNERDYDLFIIDIKMPEMNGMELYEEMDKKCSELADHTVFTSGDVIGEETELFLRKTGAPLLAKPFNSDELITIVKETLRRIEK